MKTKNIFNCCLFALLAAACQPTEQKPGNREKDTTAVENQGTDNTQEATTEEVAQVLPFISPDAMRNDVRGDVKEIKYTRYHYDEDGTTLNGDSSEHSTLFDENKQEIFDNETTTTDEDGTKYTNKIEVLEKKRNDKGQLTILEMDYTSYVDGETAYETPANYKYEYNEKGQLTKRVDETPECVDETTYIYNEDEDLIRSETKTNEGGSTYKHSNKYEILEKDRFGNWTKRKETTVTTGAEEPGTKNTTSSLVVRKLIYRQ